MIRKEKVSKAGALAGSLCLAALGLLALRPSVRVAAAAPRSVALAIAAPPPLATGLSDLRPAALHDRAQAAATCANARRELHFEMISSDPQSDPVMVPRARVCLAVYRMGGD